MRRPKLTLAAVYDTETTNIGKGVETRAFPVLFIDNDIRDVDIYNYQPDIDDKVSFYRTEAEMLARIDEYIFWGECLEVVPIICAYNLMFDLQPLMEELSKHYEIRANAQSSTNVYTLDLYSEGTHVLRFWDTYHLEMRGLAAMGETCGLEKAKGDWDYSLIRTTRTPLTDLELFYAARDVQVIPAYLRYLLHANEWMEQSDFGYRIITKTSIVRQMARREIERLTVPKADGKRLELRYAFMQLCKKELPKTYGIYALRKACFRGGWTFTAARYAMTLQRNVVSADAVSMHHTFINGRYVPQDFRVCKARELQYVCEKIVATTRQHVLERYEKPFDYAIHAEIRFRGIRLKSGSCFETWGIALLATSKFKRGITAGSEIGNDPASALQENVNRENGWYDRFDDAALAFGKLYRAREIVVHVTELELWTISRVYEWDEMEVICGEFTRRFKLPPDFVTLQSNKLFEQKSAAKYINEHYVKGEPYPYDTKFMPDGIALSLRDGTLEPQFFSEWYTSTVKGMFNGIYGTMAQDVFRPSYKCDGGVLCVDTETVTTPENYDERKPRSTRVLYTYGMRIVGGSRLHMCLLMELLYEAFGDRIRVLGGDTDSVKVSCDADVSDDDVEKAMKPIGDAAKLAIDRCMERLRKNFPDLASTLDGIGSFEIENRGRHYDLHYELWNKARVSFDGKRTHITCAGLPRPIGLYTIETFMDACTAAGNPPELVIPATVGFNVNVSHSISHTLEGYRPKPEDLYVGDVRDFKGVVSHVESHQSVALYPAPRWIGETLKLTNRLSADFLEREYGRVVDTTTRYVQRNAKTGVAELWKDTVNGPTLIMEGKKCPISTLKL